MVYRAECALETGENLQAAHHLGPGCISRLPCTYSAANAL